MHRNETKSSVPSPPHGIVPFPSRRAQSKATGMDPWISCFVLHTRRSRRGAVYTRGGFFSPLTIRALLPVSQESFLHTCLPTLHRVPPPRTYLPTRSETQATKTEPSPSEVPNLSTGRLLRKERINLRQHACTQTYLYTYMRSYGRLDMNRVSLCLAHHLRLIPSMK